MHNEIICVIKISANIAQLVQKMKSFYRDGTTCKKWTEFDSFIKKRCVSHDIVLINIMSTWTE